MLRPYVYRVLSYEVVDGDTVRTELDLGFRLRIELLARIDGVDAPERWTPAGKAVTEFVRAWCDAQESLLAVSVAQDKFAGRYVAEIHGDRGRLADELLGRGLVRIYGGGARRPWEPAELDRIEAAAREAVGTLGRR